MAVAGLLKGPIGRPNADAAFQAGRLELLRQLTASVPVAADVVATHKGDLAALCAWWASRLELTGVPGEL